MSNSNKQKALFLVEPKGQWIIQEKDIPGPGRGEVVVRVHATSLNPIEWKMRDTGRFVTEWPAIFGSDSAGVIARVGEGVTGFAVGDKVYVHLAFYSAIH